MTTRPSYLCRVPAFRRPYTLVEPRGSDEADGSEAAHLDNEPARLRRPLVSDRESRNDSYAPPAFVHGPMRMSPKCCVLN